MDALSQAIEICGSQVALAEALKLKPMAVSQWKTRGKIPAVHCRSVEALTGGKVTRYDLRPDVFGPAPDNQSAA